MEPLTSVFSEGFVRLGSLTFLSGDPGAGKTTLLVQSVAYAAERTHRPIAYMSTEQSVEAIALTFERLDLPRDMIHVCAGENVEDLIDFVHNNNCGIAILDSINEAHISRLAKGETVQMGVARALSRMARSANCVTIGIRQINKDGEAAGEVKVDHISEANVHLSVEKDGTRVLKIPQKNRFGQAPFSVDLAMTSKGLFPVS